MPNHSFPIELPPMLLHLTKVDGNSHFQFFECVAQNPDSNLDINTLSLCSEGVHTYTFPVVWALREDIHHWPL